jgi:hypothetical protein
MTAHNHGSAVERGPVTDPILATPLWRPKPSRQPHVVTETAADPHEHDWAGPGFSKPGPEPGVDYHTGRTRRKAEAVAGMTTVADPLFDGRDGEGADRARLQRPVQNQLPQGNSASAPAGAHRG